MHVLCVSKSNFGKCGPIFTILSLTESYVRKFSTNTVSEKTAFLFLSELRQIFTNFNKFWKVDGKVAEIVCCINILHLTWSTSPPYLVKPRCSELLRNVEMYYLQQTKLAHRKLNIVYLAELLVVMTDRLKIVRIRTRNVPRNLNTSA